MKRLIASVLAVCLVISTASCSAGNPRERNGSSSSSDGDSFSKIDEVVEESSADVELSDFDPDFTFTTTDRNGVTYDESIFAEHELTMINIFEPWCGPCVGEMGDLEDLYEDYSPSGFLIIGMYSDTSMEADLDDTLESLGITYPILHYTNELDQFQSGFVPTTLFVNREGHVVTTVSGAGSTYVGAMTYTEWAEIIETLLLYS